MSPKQYALAKRVEMFRDRLKRGETVTAALYDSGFNSSSRAYEASRRLGAKPRDVKTGGAALVLQAGVARCSLGFVGIAMSERGLVRAGVRRQREGGARGGAVAVSQGDS